jgi:hypothetical protein
MSNVLNIKRQCGIELTHRAKGGKKTGEREISIEIKNFDSS